MKKLFIILAIVVFLGGISMAFDVPKRDQVICACGCKEKAVKCMCPVAVEELKKFDKKYKGV